MITGDLRTRFTGHLEVLYSIHELLELVDIGPTDEQLLLAGQVKSEMEWMEKRIENGFTAAELADLAGEEKPPIASDEDHVTVTPEGGERIKDWEELRHTLAHLWNAIDHLVDGFPESAGAELQDCLDPIFWNTTDEMRLHLDGRTQRRQTVPRKTEEGTEAEGQQRWATPEEIAERLSDAGAYTKPTPEAIADAFTVWWETFPQEWRAEHRDDMTAMRIAFKGAFERWPTLLTLTER